MPVSGKVDPLKIEIPNSLNGPMFHYFIYSINSGI